MTNEQLRAEADRRFEAAVAESGARDPRDFYRQRLRELRERDAQAYTRAVQYYETELIPRVAAPDSDPVAEWLEYGRLLAELVSRGRTVLVDTTGRAREYAVPVASTELVLHVPLSTRDAVLVIGLPATLSPAQRATYDLLVGRRLE